MQKHTQYFYHITFHDGIYYARELDLKIYKKTHLYFSNIFNFLSYKPIYSLQDRHANIKVPRNPFFFNIF